MFPMPLVVAAKGTGLEGMIYAGLDTLTNDLITRRWWPLPLGYFFRGRRRTSGRNRSGS